MPETKDVSYIGAVAAAQRWALREYPEAIVYGEDVGKPGGPYGSARNLQAEFGADRVFDTPISETAMLGMGVGAAMRGMRPVVEIMFADFFLVAMDQVVNQAANVRYVSRGSFTAPLTIRTQQGAMPGSCAQHSQNLEAFFTHVPGLRVGLPATVRDAYEMLRTAIASDDPVIIIENRGLYARKGTIHTGGEVEPLGGARIVRAGSDVTIVSWSRMVGEAEAAAAELAADGVSAEVIDLRWTAPLDTATVLASLERTGRLVIVHEANVTGGVGAELAAAAAGAGFELLDAPVVRLGTPDLRMPAAPHLQAAAIPDRGSVVRAVRQLLQTWD